MPASALGKRMTAKFLGTFAFVLVGAGSAVAAQSLRAWGTSSLVVAAASVRSYS